MKLIIAVLVLVLVVETQAQWQHYPGQAIGGSRDMWRAYQDMKEAQTRDADKYFHENGNYDAARRGSKGKWAAKVIRYVICGGFDIIVFLRSCKRMA